MKSPNFASLPSFSWQHFNKNAFFVLLPCSLACWLNWHLVQRWALLVALSNCNKVGEEPCKHYLEMTVQQAAIRWCLALRCVRCRMGRESMGTNDATEDERYKVVVNQEQQYSIWPADRQNAMGWTDVGVTGNKAECLRHIETVWTDMRPLSLRKKMGEED
jgi:MbtH protein